MVKHSVSVSLVVPGEVLERGGRRLAAREQIRLHLRLDDAGHRFLILFLFHKCVIVLIDDMFRPF